MQPPPEVHLGRPTQADIPLTTLVPSPSKYRSECWWVPGDGHAYGARKVGCFGDVASMPCAPSSTVSCTMTTSPAPPRANMALNAGGCLRIVMPEVYAEWGLLGRSLACAVPRAARSRALGLAPPEARRNDFGIPQIADLHDLYSHQFEWLRG